MPFPQAIAKFKAQTFPKRIRPLIEPLLKNSFSTHCQGTGPWEGPIHFSRFVPGVLNCSKLCQSWSWSQEKNCRPFPEAIAKFKSQTFPKRIRPLIDPLLKNRFSTHFQSTGPWEGRIHFRRFFPGVLNCSKLYQSWSWSQEKNCRPFPEAIAKFQSQTFPTRIRPLIKPLLKNNFSTHFQGTGPWEGPIHFSRFVLRVHNFAIAANFSRADPGAKKRKAFYKSNCQVQSPNLSQKNQTAYWTLIKEQFSASFSRADPGAKRRKVGLFQKQLPSSNPKPFQKESGR